MTKNRTSDNQPSQRGSSAKIKVLKEAIANYEPSSNAIIDAVEEEKLAPAKAKAVRLINHRARSEHELKCRLLEADFDHFVVDRVVERCKENGMIDDAAFASEWVRQRQKHQKKSRSVLRRELQDKGIAEDLINLALEQVNDEAQEHILWALVWKKAQSVKSVPRSKADYDRALRRIVGVGARRGFPQGQVLTLAKQALAQRCEELG